MLFSKAKIKISNDMILNTAFEIVRDNGIEKLVASETLKVTEEQIRDLLSYEFQALMLLEENPNNK